MLATELPESVFVCDHTVKLTSEQDVIDLFGKMYPLNKLLIYQNNLSDEFFDLSTKVAGDILQKLVNYRVVTAFVVDVDSIKSARFKEMMNEANTGHEFRFFTDPGIAISWLTGG